MSLKVFHVIFIIVSVAMSGMLAAWSFQNQTPPLVGYFALGAIVLLLIYGVWFLRKARHIIT